MKTVGRAALICFLELGLGCSDTMPPDSGTVSGTVLDGVDSSPIVGASVTVGSRSMATTSTGQFTIADVSAGNQQIQIEADEYVTTTLSVNVPSGSTVQQDVALNRDCIDSGSGSRIQSALGGGSELVLLCPGSQFELPTAIQFVNDEVTLRTWGEPQDDQRALLELAPGAGGSALELRDRSDVVVSHLRIDGRIAELGPADDGGALIQAGGIASGQIIRSVQAGNTRTWTILHLAEGDESQGGCRNAIVENNEFGPARGLGIYDWADGISLACRSSIVRNNTIVDPSDGGIVIFGAPGSIIEGNTIRAVNHPLLGGINLVDFGPYNGDYTGTIVRGNTIDAMGARIQIGIAMGVRVWICFNPEDRGDLPEDPTIRGASVTGNTLRGPFMGYGFAISGVQDWIATGNVDHATHSGEPKNTCNGELSAPPAGFQVSQVFSSGTFQSEFQDARLELALWTIDDPPQIGAGR